MAEIVGSGLSLPPSAMPYRLIGLMLFYSWSLSHWTGLFYDVLGNETSSGNLIFGRMLVPYRIMQGQTISHSQGPLGQLSLESLGVWDERSGGNFPGRSGGHVN